MKIRPNSGKPQIGYRFKWLVNDIEYTIGGEEEDIGENGLPIEEWKLSYTLDGKYKNNTGRITKKGLLESLDNYDAIRI